MAALPVIKDGTVAPTESVGPCTEFKPLVFDRPDPTVRRSAA